MKLGILLVAALLLGPVLAHWLMAERGYVLINFYGYSVEMSVPILILALVVLYLLVRLLVKALAAPRRLGEATGRIRDMKARKRLNQGLIEFSEGNFLRSERLLTKGVRRADMPLVNYLAAARAAQAQGAYERRDTWLRMAHEQSPDAASAILLTQAELQMSEKQDEAALATLRRLLEDDPDHTRAMAMLARLHRRNGRWQELHELLPALRKARVLEPDVLNAMEKESHMELLGVTAAAREPAQVTAHWQRVPKALRKDTDLVRRYVLALRDAGDARTAELVARKALKGAWDDKMALVYGTIEADAGAQLKHVERWLKARGNDAVLLLTAGRLCMRSELWGKARSYLETSITIAASADAYQLYGKLMDQMGEEDAASLAYRSGLALATESVTGGVPALEAPQKEAPERPAES